MPHTHSRLTPWRVTSADQVPDRFFHGPQPCPVLATGKRPTWPWLSSPSPPHLSLRTSRATKGMSCSLSICAMICPTRP
jgi:hypothetical protein